MRKKAAKKKVTVTQMSNHECWADVYELAGKRFVRCFLNGVVRRIRAKGIPKKCPFCRRPLRPAVSKRTKVRMVRTIQIRTSLGWVDHAQEIEELTSELVPKG